MEQTLLLYQTPTHPCGYFDDRPAVSRFVDPRVHMDPRLYGQLMELGFRRSGEQVYRPACPGCSACRSARIPVAAFQPNRSQRRTLRANAGVTATARPAGFIPEHYELYLRYVRGRHAGGGMDEDDPAKFLGFLTASWSDTRFLELREDGRLLAVAVTDVTPAGLSAVYTFFDPDLAGRSLGTLAILSQLRWARELGLPYLYLGYWIAGHPKMDYKRRFRPLEIYDSGDWGRLGPDRQATDGPAASATSP